MIGLYALAIVKVTSIDESEKLIHGRVQNDVGEHTGYTEGDDISFPESEVIDWKISHPNGAEEGDVVGKYFASLGPDINVNGLLADQRDADLGKLENSKTVESALDNTFLRLFDDKNLKVEVLPSSIAPAIKVWPSLYRKYRDLTPDALIAELNKRAAAIAKTDKVTVEPSSFQDKSLIMVSAYVVLGKNDVLFEINQYLHFYFDRKGHLDRVAWGLRAGRWMNLPPKASPSADPILSPGTPPAAQDSHHG